MLDGIDGGVRGLRIGWDEAYAADGTDPKLLASIRRAIRRLEGLGARLVEVKVPEVGSTNALTQAEAVVAHQANFPSRRDEYGPFFREFLELGAAVTGVQYAEAHRERLRFAGSLRSVLRDVDVIACPALPWPAPLAPPERLYGTMAEVMDPFEGDWFRYTARYDLSGSPPLTIPCGFSDEALPHTIQFVGRHFDEARLCRIGHAYEQETDWHQRHPPV